MRLCSFISSKKIYIHALVQMTKFPQEIREALMAALLQRQATAFSLL